MTKRKTKPLLVSVGYSSDPNAPTLKELQQGKGVGVLVPMFEAYFRSKQKETPKPVESEESLVQAS